MLASFVPACVAPTELDIGPASAEYEVCHDAQAAAAFGRAESLLAQGRLAEALTELEIVIGRCQDFVAAHVVYQDAALELGGPAEDAMRALYAAMADRPRSPVPPFVRGRLEGEDFERQAALDEAIARDPSFYPAYVEKAKMLRRLGQTVNALDLLQRALAAQPECPEANLQIAEVLSGLGRGREAAPYYANYIELEPDDLATERDYLSLLVYTVGRLDEAERVARELLSEDGEDVVVLMDLAAIQWKRGDHEAAARLYHRVLDIDPSRDRAVLNLANLHYGPLARGSDAQRREAWSRARAAYRYFLGMRRAEGFFDIIDYHVGVPYRLGRIEELLGPGPEQPPTPADF